jgi:hypothetical protein
MCFFLLVPTMFDDVPLAGHDFPWYVGFTELSKQNCRFNELVVYFLNGFMIYFHTLVPLVHIHRTADFF